MFGLSEPFADNQTAAGRVFENWERMIIAITVIGTHSNIPVMPQILPQIASDKIIAKGLRLSVSPSNFGSTTWPMNVCTACTPPATTRNGTIVLNCINASTAGKIVATIDPITGMKFRMNIRNAQKDAKSNPTATITRYERSAVVRLVAVLIPK